MPDSLRPPPDAITLSDLQQCCGVYTYRGYHLGIPVVGPDRLDDAIDRAYTVQESLLANRCPVEYDPPTMATPLFDPFADDYSEDQDEYDDDYGYDRRNPDLIHSYSFTPDWRMNGTDSPVFMGAELEVENERGVMGTMEAAELAISCLSRDAGPEYYGFLKDDGSIGDGFEIVTHPMTYRYAVEQFPWDMLSQLYRAGFRGASNCGLHIHVSRSAFDGPGHIYRWLKFIYRNPTPIQALARRGSVNYSRWDGDVRMNAKEHAKGSTNAPRYVAVNVQNVSTLEVRMFRSSLNVQSVQAAFAFVDSSVEYTRQLTCQDIAGNNGWSWKAYFDYVQKAKDRWAALVAEVDRRFRGRDIPQDRVPADRWHNPWGTRVNPWGETVPAGPHRATATPDDDSAIPEEIAPPIRPTRPHRYYGL